MTSNTRRRNGHDQHRSDKVVALEIQLMPRRHQDSKHIFFAKKIRQKQSDLPVTDFVGSEGLEFTRRGGPPTR